MIYFYSDGPMRVEVGVRFKAGVVTQWYPNASYIAELDFTTLSERVDSMKWNVDLIADPVSLLPVPPDDIWQPSRQVPGARPLQATVGDEREFERFVFYRGVGDFKAGLQVTSTLDGEIVLRNLTSAFFRSKSHTNPAVWNGC